MLTRSMFIIPYTMRICELCVFQVNAVIVYVLEESLVLRSWFCLFGALGLLCDEIFYSKLLVGMFL